MTAPAPCATCHGTGHVEGFQFHAGCTVAEPIRETCPTCSPAPAPAPRPATDQARRDAEIDAIPF